MIEFIISGGIGIEFKYFNKIHDELYFNNLFTMYINNIHIDKHCFH